MKKHYPKIIKATLFLIILSCASIYFGNTAKGETTAKESLSVSNYNVMGINANAINNLNYNYGKIMFSHWGNRKVALAKEISTLGDIAAIQEVAEPYHITDFCQELNKLNAGKVKYKIVGNNYNIENTAYKGRCLGTQFYEAQKRNTNDATKKTNNAIVYSIQRFTLWDYGHYVFKNNVQNDINNNDYRNAVWALLKDEKNNEMILFASTHFTHYGVTDTSETPMQLVQFQETSEMMKSLENNFNAKDITIAKTIIAGDFNIDYKNEKNKPLLDDKIGTDYNCNFNNSGTFLGDKHYKDDSNKSAIYKSNTLLDYVCISSKESVQIEDKLGYFVKSGENSPTVFSDNRKIPMISSDHVSATRTIK